MQAKTHDTAISTLESTVRVLEQERTRQEDQIGMYSQRLEKAREEIGNLNTQIASLKQSMRELGKTND